MSGGSLDYAYRKVQDAAEQIKWRATTPLHRALVAHLEKVASALHDLEWVWSSDMSPGDEDAAIRDVVSPAEELDATILMALVARGDLEESIQRAQGVKGEHE